ncbi:MAG: DUF3450 family protein [Planctomycetota bacterium]
MNTRNNVLCTAACAAALAALAPAQTKEALEEARAALQKRAEAWQLISKEKSDWALGKEILADRIGMAERETKGLREKTADADKNILESDKKHAELVAENDRLEAATAGLSAPLAALEQRLRALLPRLPQPLRDHVSTLSQRLPEKPDESGLHLGERFAAVVTILQEIDKWNRAVTVGPEIQRLSTGATAEVTAIYLGIGQGWYVTTDGKHAGIGTASDAGWVWTPADGAAEAVQAAIDIYKKKKTAAYVQLPVTVQ